MITLWFIFWPIGILTALMLGLVLKPLGLNRWWVILISWLIFGGLLFTYPGYAIWIFPPSTWWVAYLIGQVMRLKAESKKEKSQ